MQSRAAGFAVPGAAMSRRHVARGALPLRIAVVAKEND
jgi:hypothetical protein